MLISYKYKFIFVHNPKAAGSSIRLALQNYALDSPLALPWFNLLCENTKIGRKISFFMSYNVFNNLSTNKFAPHDTAENLVSIIGKSKWNEFYKFGFVRNPFDREVSNYHYILGDPNHFQHNILRDLGSFKKYIRWGVNGVRGRQKSYFYNRENKLLVDYVGKLENIGHDFPDICLKIGVDAKLPHTNLSKREPDYRNYYDAEIKALVADYFKEDIELFEYEF